MNFRLVLMKVVRYLYNRKDPIFSADVERDKKFLSHFDEPIDDIQRSYFQYKSQSNNKGFLLNVLMNVNAIFFVIPFLLGYLLKRSKSDKVFTDATFLSSGFNLDIIPNELRDKYKNISIVGYDNNAFLNKTDVVFIFNIVKRYPFSFYFLFKNMLKIALYRGVIDLYHPRAIITYSEYSFTSSILTMYCELNNIKHINIMHGEKLFIIDDSFFRFHNFYVWDKYYINFFIKQRAYKNQFVVSIPNSLKLDLNKYKIDEKNKYDVKYYLGAETKTELNSIYNTLIKLKLSGCKVCVRPHPRYTSFSRVNEIFENIEVEDYKSVEIGKSIAGTEYIVSLFSTVLNQGYNNGKKIIIDDITNPEKYNKLEKLGYLILNKKPEKLSNFMNNKV